MTTGYVKRLSDGRVLCSNTSQDPSNPAHLEALQRFVTSRGMNLADYDIGFSDDDSVVKMIKDAVTLAEKWKEDIAGTDGAMPRYLEDHIKDDHNGVAGNEFLQGKYDDKKALRATKP